MKKQCWRLIRSGPGSAAWNMALDEAINRNCLEGFSPPTLRFYGWQKPAVTIGRFQKWPPLNVPILSDGTEMVRRITGGRAVRHGGDLTFSISVGSDSVGPASNADEKKRIPAHPRKGFLAVAKLIKSAFRKLNVELEWGQGEPAQQSHPDCFVGTEAFELGFEGEKIFGCAQKRLKKGLLQQGTVRLEPFRKHLEPGDLLALESSLLLELTRVFEEGLEVEFPSLELTRAEWDLALKLEKLRYRNPSWNTLGKPIKI